MSISTSPSNNYTPNEVPELGLSQDAPQLNINNNIPPLPSRTTINYSTVLNNTNAPNNMAAAAADMPNVSV